MATGIAWTDETWNPTTGCNQVSPGCAHCYAKALTERWGKVFENVVLHEDRLRKPLSWRTPRRVFVNSMSDLFHESIPDEFIDKVFAVMALTPQHQYQVLTKRPERMREYVSAGWSIGRSLDAFAETCNWLEKLLGPDAPVSFPQFPLPNVWLGVSVENQHWADERIPILLDTPAAVRFISAEPLLGWVDIERQLWGGICEAHSPFRCDCRPTRMEEHWLARPGLDWVIVGGESGSKRRPFDMQWARDLKRQCDEAGVAYFFKQTGAFKPGVPSGDPELDAAKAWPEV